MGEITKIKIFPSIGIMRVGNSPDEYFIGPEVPGHFEVPEGGFKDAQCRLKRQAARFRLYGYDDAGSKPVEITAQDATITWKVTLANKKASWKCIFPQPDEKEWRNDWYKGDREALNIRPTPRKLTGKNQGPAKFDDGKFLKKENGTYVQTETVFLGEMRTDELGRLLVLGGFGKAGGVEPEGVLGYPDFVRTFNTAGWYDDIADGPVTAEVTLNSGQVITDILPAWVLSAPPAFAPQISHLTTLYDALRQTALNKLPAELVKGLEVPAKPSFARDVLPILQRALDLYWLTDLVKYGQSGPQDSPHFQSFKEAATDASARKNILNYLKPPGNPQKGSMPLFWGDNYSNQPSETVLTPTQYSIMENWAKDDWSDPGLQAPVPFENPEDLTQAALEGCVGGALYPGIEASRFLRDKCEYIEPFRLKHGFIKEDGAPLEAGDVTRDMALPWHGDFAHCRQEGIYAWWPAQHPDNVFPDINSTESKLWVRDIINNESFKQDRIDMVQRWHQLGFVVRKGDRFIETERHKVCNDLFLILDRTHFSSKEVPNTFENCFYVVIEGFRPSDFGIEKQPLSVEELQSIAPITTLKHDGSNDDTSGMKALPQELLFEIVPFDKEKPQRLTFVYKIEFTNDTDFTGAGKEKITLTAKKKHPTEDHFFSATGELTLFKQPNPYMQDGPKAWLSKDVGVFKVSEGGSAFGFLFNKVEEDTAAAAAEAASGFIKSVVFEFNKDHSKVEGHPFEQLQAAQADTQLELAEKPGGTRVFNFAVARVRYRGKAQADNVRVFFRLFTTAATGLDYREDTTYRRRQGNDPIALLGYQAGNIVSIPCYANPRIDSEELQTDGLNVKTLDAGNDDEERYYYFGCWLDFNQTTPRLPDPLNPGQKKSIQDHIRGLHQCLVAEIHFQDDEIPEGATPASSENLSQRNLMYVESPNPGKPATRLVQHTFEIKAAPQVPPFAAAAVAATDGKEARHDELMIRWNDLPRTAQVTLYMPGVASEVLGLAERSYEARRLEQSQAHTIHCLPGDVTYLPLPTTRTENIPALLSIELPEGIRRGDEFNIVVHQISGRPRRILGAFQINISVSTRAALLRPEIHYLSVLRHIFRSIPVDDRWHPVFARYLEQVAGRVSGFGGDPKTVEASPDGSGMDETAARCTQLSWLVSLMLALFIIVAGIHPLANYLPEIIAIILLIAALVWWVIGCKPSVCRIVITCLVGLGVGAAILAAFLLAGLAQPYGLLVLSVAALIFGALTVAGLLSGCLSFTEKQQT